MGEHDVPVTATRDRTLLAMLLLHANSITPTERLIDAIWADRAPQDARALLQGCVSRLRKRFAEAGAIDQVIVTEPAGYRITVDPDGLDLLEFRRLLAEARTANQNGEPEQATDLYRAALRLWRGPALAGIDSTLVRQAATALDEERTQAREERFAVELATGGAGELVAELTELVQQHPHREGLHHALMLALYRAGRQADALAVYRHARQLIQDDLGTEPGHDLQELHRAILNRDPHLDPHHQPTPATPATPIPRELPADVAAFTGRAEALKVLDELLSNGKDSVGPVVISAIAGTAGVGKTALAIHWAHQVAERFPDGQLYVNLHGYDESTMPTGPAEAVRSFLDALQVPAQRVPTATDAQIRLYRSLLAGKRMLIVLDNARNAEQVRPLLPGAPGCLVVVTSRNQLTSLVAAEEASPIVLDLFSMTEARQFLADRLSRKRVDTEPQAVDDIIVSCARLPLALAVASARAANYSGFSLAALAARLRKADVSLDAFDDGDPVTDVRTVFSWSYHALSHNAARLFRLLSLHPGPDATVAAVASLSSVHPAQVRPILAELTRAHLLAEHAPGRYTCHDLLRAYGAELVNAVDPENERRRAQHRILDHYVHSAHAAARLLAPRRDPLDLTPPQQGVVPEDIPDHRQAMAWLTAEHAVLLAAIEQAADRGFLRHAWQLAWTLVDNFDRRGRWHELASAQRCGLQAVGQGGDRIGQAHSHRSLARTKARLGHYEDAYAHYHRALEIYGELGDLSGQGITSRNLMSALERQGRSHEALGYAEQALKLYRAAGHQDGQAGALNDIGWCRAQLGDYRQALAYCQQALELQQETADRVGQAATWHSLGYAHHHLGEDEQASACYQQAVNIYRDLDHSYYEAWTLIHLGDVHHAAYSQDNTHRCWQRALEILDRLGHPDASHVRSRLKRLAA